MAVLDLVSAHAGTLHHMIELAAPPNPGAGQAPPGSEKLLTILRWVAWGVSFACVLGVLTCAAKMAISHRRGEGGEHATSLGWVLGACFLAGSASGLVGMILS
ncbi:hypothetical protein [Streptomyces sp. NPDC018045]|uniref:hypothetical protein n=1 Tax=Streptomyces sp. NPDC018045 TaxID=3365037 RepID=UPI0037A39387